jgi:hypothetical protein
MNTPATDPDRHTARRRPTTVYQADHVNDLGPRQRPRALATDHPTRDVRKADPDTPRTRRRTSADERTLQTVELQRVACCGKEWVGADRAHCCARANYAGCGEVLDDAELFDAHRRAGRCTDPRRLGLVQTKNGIWLRALDLIPAS